MNYRKDIAKSGQPLFVVMQPLGVTSLHEKCRVPDSFYIYC